MNSKLKVVTPPTAQLGQMRLEHLTAKERIDSTHTEELVIALCGPIGSPMNDVARKLDQVLREVFGYQTVVLRVDQYVQDFAARQGHALPQGPAERRSALIEYGSRMRTEFGVSVLAELAVNGDLLARFTIRAVGGADLLPVRLLPAHGLLHGVAASHPC